MRSPLTRGTPAESASSIARSPPSGSCSLRADPQERRPVLHPPAVGRGDHRRAEARRRQRLRRPAARRASRTRARPSRSSSDEFGEEVAFLVDGVTKLGKINFTRGGPQARTSARCSSRWRATSACSSSSSATASTTCARSTHEAPRSRSASRARRWTSTRRSRTASASVAQERARGPRSSYLEPDAYAEPRAKVEEDERRAREVHREVCKLIQPELSSSRLRGREVTGRAKHLYSIYRKMQSQQCDFEQVYDVVAFRVLVESVADCYAALGVVHSQWTPVPGRFKDYIALPKPNMYQSLHTTVIGPGRERIEIQIRTHEMHRVAEHGIAAHWKYKERSGGVDPRDAARSRLAAPAHGVPEGAQGPGRVPREREGRPLPRRGLRLHAQGRRARLPARLDPIDFAYAVHSEVGDHCSGARVNGSIVPLRYKLRNGDVVEIITSANQSRARTGSTSSSAARRARASAPSCAPSSASARSSSARACSRRRCTPTASPRQAHQERRGDEEAARALQALEPRGASSRSATASSP
jgi:(p)ppGpp synthase/HD superfamily hydrolase